MSKLADVSRRAKELGEVNSELERESSRLKGRVCELEGKLEDALGERDAALETARVLRKELSISRSASSAAASRPTVPPAAEADGRSGEEQQVMMELEELKMKVVSEETLREQVMREREELKMKIMSEESLREQVMREREELKKQVMDLRGQLENGASGRDLGGNTVEGRNLSNTATDAIETQKGGGVAGDVAAGNSEDREGDHVVEIAAGRSQRGEGASTSKVVGGHEDVEDAERRASEAERRIGDAERRASEAEKKFGDAERRAFELASLVAELEGRMRGDGGQNALVASGVRLRDGDASVEVMEGVGDVLGVLQGVRQGGRALLERAGAVERERDAAVKERDAVLIERDVLMMRIEATGGVGSDELTEKEVLRLRKEVSDLQAQVAKHRREKDGVGARGEGECVREVGAKRGERDDEEVQAGGKAMVLGDELQRDDHGDIQQEVIRLRGELSDALGAKAKADKGVHDRDAAMQVHKSLYPKPGGLN